MNDSPGIPKTLEDAEIDRIHLINHSTILVEFSTGDAVVVEAARLKEVALRTGELLPPDDDENEVAIQSRKLHGCVLRSPGSPNSRLKPS